MCDITQLVYFESSDDVTAAIAREKQIKGPLRSKKIELIKTLNPQWKDLSVGWFDNNPPCPLYSGHHEV